MTDKPWLIFLAIALAAPGTLYVGARRDEVSSFWFVVVVGSFIAMGVGYTEEFRTLFWAGACALILSSSLASVQILRKRKVSRGAG